MEENFLKKSSIVATHTHTSRPKILVSRHASGPKIFLGSFSGQKGVGGEKRLKIRYGRRRGGTTVIRKKRTGGNAKKRTHITDY